MLCSRDLISYFLFESEKRDIESSHLNQRASHFGLGALQRSWRGIALGLFAHEGLTLLLWVAVLLVIFHTPLIRARL